MAALQFKRNISKSGGAAVDLRDVLNLNRRGRRLQR
jgi:hypothetical protein